MKLLRSSVHSAFTLVEVLVALLIIGGIMLALVQLLDATRISRDTIHNIQETQLAGPAIMDLIERDVRAITIYDRASDQLLRVKNRVLLGHEADRLDLVATTDSVVLTQIDDRLVRSDVNEVGYVLRINPNDAEFLELYRREDFGVDDEPFEGGAYTFLHDHVKDFEIQVYEEDGRDAQPLDDWGQDEEHSGLPFRLEIRLTLELTPRLTHEQLRIAPVDKRTVTYTRIIRLPQSLRDQLERQPVPQIPAFIDSKKAGSSGNSGDSSSNSSTGNSTGSNTGGSKTGR